MVEWERLPVTIFGEEKRNHGNRTGKASRQKAVDGRFLKPGTHRR
jgi:hypothetical protein